jgi:hypothetical protein
MLLFIYDFWYNKILGDFIRVMDTLNISRNLVNASLEQKIADVLANTLKKEIEQEVIMLEKDFVKTNELSGLSKEIKNLKWFMGAGFVVIGIVFGHIISLLNTIIGVLPSVTN